MTLIPNNIIDNLHTSHPVFTNTPLSTVECDVDLYSGTVLARTLGANPSAARGQPLPCGETASLRHGDTLELLSGQHRFTVRFSPAPTSSPSPGPAASSVASQGRPAAVKRPADSVDGAAGGSKDGAAGGSAAKRARSAGGTAGELGEEKERADDDVVDQETQTEEWTSTEKDQLLLFISKGVKPAAKVRSCGLSLMGIHVLQYK